MEELGGAKLLDENDSGMKLYKISNEIFNTVVLIETDNTEMVLRDMQDPDQPTALEDVGYYDWVRLEDMVIYEGGCF